MCVNHCSTPTYAECCSTLCSMTSLSVTHHFISLSAPLVTGQVLYPVEGRGVHAPSHHSMMSIIRSRPHRLLHVRPTAITSMFSIDRAAIVQWTCTDFRRRAFAICSPDIWNNLPPSLCNIISHPAFRQALKTHFYKVDFFPCFYSWWVFIMFQA